MAIAEPNPKYKRWLEQRRRTDAGLPRVTASDAPSVCGVGFQTPVELWAQKCGLIEPDDETWDMVVGSVMQTPIVKLASYKMGLPIVEEEPWTLRVHPELDWLGASLDAYYVDPDDGLVPVEIKSVAYQADAWFGAEPPLRVNVQIQAQMAVTGAKKAVACGFIGGRHLAWKPVVRDQRFIDALLPELEKFCRYVATETCPPVDGTEATARAIARMYECDDELSVELPPEAERWDAKAQKIKRLVKKLEERGRFYENNIRLAIKAASVGRLGSGFEYTFKTVHRAGYSVQPTCFRELRRRKTKGKK